MLCMLGFTITLPAGLGAERAEDLYHRALRLDELRAIPLLLRAQALAPKNRQIAYRLGFLYQKMSRLTQAEAYYQTTLRLDACHIKALNNLGGLRLDQGRTLEAQAFYLRAVRCRGSYFLPYYNLAGLLLEAGEVARAAEMYVEALKRNPKHPASHHNLGITYERMARQDPVKAGELRRRAANHLQAACNLEPKNALNFFNYGRLLFNLNRLGEVEVPLRRAIALSAGDSRLIGRALAMLAQLPRPDAKKEPGPYKEPDAKKEPGASKEPNAKKEPAAGRPQGG